MRFILNDRTITTEAPSGMVLVDFLREEKRLKGTKIGCREGDCGACTILMGELIDGEMRYRSLTSCITPLGNMAGKHVVTVEGINMEPVSPVQRAMVDEGGTQCGFCTVGFVMSLTGYILSTEAPTAEAAISAIDGNICRCTGYKPIERAAASIGEMMAAKPQQERLEWLVKNDYLPAYFEDIPKRLKALESPLPKGDTRIIGGGTDLYVQRPDDFVEADVWHAEHLDWNGITVNDGICTIGGGCKVTDLMESKALQDAFPQLYNHLKLVSSTPIRNISTIAGNFVNASPIGDLTAFFIALDTTLLLTNDNDSRQLKLADFYKGYKDLDLKEGEYITALSFALPDENTHFNLEKVSKRIYLDIASVNTAIQLKIMDGMINTVHISGGGVGPTPLRLQHTSDALQGQELTFENIEAAIAQVEQDISPMSDVRGSAEYKTLLLKQLIRAHFHTLFPAVMREEAEA